MRSIAAAFSNLQRRGVLRVAGIYCVAAWGISEVAISLEEPLGLPGSLDTSIVIVLAIGFPIALLLAYAFNLTPEGIKRHRIEEPGNTLVERLVFVCHSYEETNYYHLMTTSQHIRWQ